MTQGLRQVLFHTLRLILRFWPLPRGKTRLQSWAARRLCRTPQASRTSDDRTLMLQFPRDRGWEEVYFTGTFETGTTDVLRRLLRADDITFDIGANIGWYTTLFARGARSGHCHAFEPHPAIFEQLSENCRINEIAANVTLNNAALADREGSVAMYSFAGLPHSHTSMSAALGGLADAVTTDVTTMDRYCEGRQIQRIDLIKVDVEGAEMMVLKGAERVFSLRLPPIWVLEINYQTSKAFGYTPVELLRFLARQGNFQFFRVVQGWGELIRMSRLEDCAQSDNVLCVPAERQTRLSDLG